MLKNLKKNQSGFTIIEVLIVLAIAGLIMVAVFTAVPALQRNGANTTKRGDAAKVIGAVAEFVSNNNGKVPVAANALIIKTNANANAAASVTVVTGFANVATLTDNDSYEVVTGAICNTAGVVAPVSGSPSAANLSAMAVTGSLRSYAVLFTVDASGGKVTPQCAGS